MRTVLNLDADVPEAAKDLAALQHRALGEVISDLVRRGLRPTPAHRPVRNGVLLLPGRPVGVIVTPAQIRRLEEETR